MYTGATKGYAKTYGVPQGNKVPTVHSYRPWLPWTGLKTNESKGVD